MPTDFDFNVLRYGELLTLDPLTEEAEDWVRFNLDDPVRWGDGIVIDPEEALTLIEALLDEGYSVNDDNLPF